MPLFSLLLILLIALAAPARADQPQDIQAASGVVSGFDDALLGIMKNAKPLGYQGRYDQIALAVDKAFDIAFTAKLLVGPDGNQIAADKMAALTDRFRRFTIATYASRFDGYNGEKIDLTGQPTMQRDDIRVQTQIQPSGGAAPVKLDYILHRDSKGWQIIDIFLQGTISQLATQRAEFQSVLKSGGIDALIAALDQKIAALASSPAAAKYRARRLLSLLLGAVCAAGIAHLVVGTVAVHRFARRNPVHTTAWPAVTMLKPLYGAEPLLYEALRSFCVQDYPAYQVVFGVRDPHDPALQVVARLRGELPHVDIAVVIDATLHGANRKVSNLINMERTARHDLYVISDSDMHVNCDYLRRVVAEFDHPNTGLVTSLYTGQPVFETTITDFAVSNINHIFMPSALVGMLCGRSDCFGATMALSRETLQKLGGWSVISDQLADDFVLGREVKALGLGVRLATVLPATTVAEPDLRTLLSHEMRWARTIRTMAPIGSIAGLIQYPVAFALMACLVSGALLPYVELLAVGMFGTHCSCFGDRQTFTID